VAVGFVCVSPVQADQHMPTVVSVTTFPQQQSLAACGQNRYSIEKLSINLSDNNPGLQKIADLQHYAFIHTGSDAELNSSSCTTLSGDDRLVRLQNMTIRGPQHSPTVTFDVPATLSDGRYALMICDGITDAAGNALDGDRNGAEGGHFIQSFRVSQGNLFTNAHFDHCAESPVTLNPWFTYGDNNSAHIATSTPDAQHSTLSGALFIENTFGQTAGVSQCIELGSSRSYQFSVTAWNAANTADIPVTLSCQYSNTAGCASFGTTTQRQYLLRGSDSGWHTYSNQHVVPNAARSAFCSVEISGSQRAAVYLDDFLFVSTTASLSDHIFSDSLDR